MGSRIRHVTIDCDDPWTLAQWWARALDGRVTDLDEPGDDDALLELADAPDLLFQRVPEGKTVKNRLHFDIWPSDLTRDEEVERLLGHGAQLHEDHRKPDGSGWVTLLDPEGNEFCVERSAGERAEPGG